MNPRRKDINCRWDFVITFIKLFEPEKLNYKTSWGVLDDCKFINLCKWAKYNE